MLWKRFGMYALLIILVVGFSLAAPTTFFTTTTLFNVLKQASVAGVVSCGVTMMLLTGAIDLSCASRMAIITIMVSTMMLNGVPIIVSILAGIVVGARLLVDYGTELARLFGVPESIIGATLVAIGTSLPELVTTLTAIAKKEASMSVGNIIGANVIDLTMILPVCSAVSGGALTIGAQTTMLDMPACLLLCCAAVIPPLAMERFYRWQGVLILGLYAGYVALLVT